MNVRVERTEVKALLVVIIIPDSIVGDISPEGDET